MNYETRLERLRERFLRANTKELFESACVEGGSILIQAQENGVQYVNQSIKEMVAGTHVRNPSNEAIQALYFRNFASLESRDKTFYNSVMRTEDTSVLAERFAAFCLELIDSLDVEPEREDDELHKQALNEWNAGATWKNISEKLTGEPERSKSFSQAVKRYAKRNSLNIRIGSPGTKSNRNE